MCDKDNDNLNSSERNVHPLINIFQSSNNNNQLNPKYSRIVQSLQWRQKYQNENIYTIDINKHKLTIDQINNGEMKGLGTGTFVWPAAHVLCKYLEIRYQSLSGYRVCDIGSGTGITGFAACLLDAKEVYLTDQENIIFLLENNTKLLLNQCPHINPSSLNIQLYNWGDSSDHLNPPFDLLLISDCVLPKLYPIDLLIQATINLMDEKTIALFSYEHRVYPDYDPRQEFKRLCDINELVVVNIPLSDHHPLYRCDDIEIWQVSKKLDKDINHANIHRGIDTYVQPIDWGEHLTNVDINCLVPFNDTIINITISINQSIRRDSIGSILWPSSIISSRYVLAHSYDQMKSLICIPDRFNTNNSPIALELGAGCGLTGLILWLRGYEVIITDKSSCLSCLQSNISIMKSYIQTNYSELFRVLKDITVIEYDWLSSEKSSLDLKHEIFKKIQSKNNHYDDSTVDSFVIDMIVCSDCCYSVLSMPSLLNSLHNLSSRNTLILLVNEPRTAFDHFLTLSNNVDSSLRYSMIYKDIELHENDMKMSIDKSLKSFVRPIRVVVAKMQK